MDEKSMNIQWYPGHMTKTRRIMEADLKLVDAVCEILDARIPISSRNPDIDTICGSKPRMIILNRIDMADPVMVARWSEYFKRKGWAVIQTDCKSRKGINQFAPAVRTLLARSLARYAGKRAGRPAAEADGGRDSECRQVDLHQPDRGEKGREGREPARRHARQAVGHGGSGAAPARHAGHPLAEIRGSAGRDHAPGLHRRSEGSM